MSLLRLGPAAEYIGVHPVTLRRWADEGRVAVTWVGRERRFDSALLDVFVGRVEVDRPRREALYVRVSGTAGQEPSLVAQEAELRATAVGEVMAVFKDRASGLRENRPGLTRLLKAAAAGEFTVVRVTHSDRLARFGIAWLTALLARDGVTVEVLHPKGSAGGVEELLDDFLSLVAMFAGRMYGIRSRDAKRRLLAAAGEGVG
ncbi:IS607 family transposase [Micromonospora sp. NPDC023814]|uniref:IS607 family transposase n=1 Tax=Micromonospora sp. NPDC023814 TaxID=3154596 RepID=UPI00340E0503